MMSAMSQMETCWLGCVTSQHIGCRIPEVFIRLGFVDGCESTVGVASS